MPKTDGGLLNKIAGGRLRQSVGPSRLGRDHAEMV